MSCAFFFLTHMTTSRACCPNLMLNLFIGEFYSAYLGVFLFFIFTVIQAVAFSFFFLPSSLFFFNSFLLSFMQISQDIHAVQVLSKRHNPIKKKQMCAYIQKK